MAMVYKITNNRTGETHTGSMRELADVLGVFPSTISRAANDGTSLSGWKVDKLPGEKDTHNSQIPYTLWEEWVRVTAPFKAASARQKKVV